MNDSALGGAARGQSIREVGSAVLEGSASKTRKTSRKRKAQPVDYTGAYFQHTNFERAVIATNGRAPYNNKEVEMITKPEGFDPSSYHFKHNWVNNLMKSGKKSPRHHAYGTSAFAGSVDGQSVGKNMADRVPSASVTQTANFDGLNLGNANNNANADAQSVAPKGSHEMPSPGRPAKNNLVKDSPMTMMELANEKPKNDTIDQKRLSSTGDSIIHGTSHFGGQIAGPQKQRPSRNTSVD